MCLLALVAGRRHPTCEVSVATFDHRSGAHSAAAAAFVDRAAREAGFIVHVGAASASANTEAAWRDARWAFLRERARTRDALILTAHTADDQLETVVMRILRGSGARGLAGLYAPAPGIERPFVNVTRHELEEFALARGLTWVEDPTNRESRFFRNRVRHDLLPALSAACPSLAADLMALSREAANVRREVDRISMRWEQSRGGRTLSIDAGLLTQLPGEERALVWQSILSRHGIVLDRRGMARLSQLDSQAPTGFRLQLSGGIEAMRLRDEVVLQPIDTHSSRAVQITDQGDARFGEWLFRLGHPEVLADDAPEPRQWDTWIPAAAEVLVREWTAGDRLAGGPDRLTRRVARFLADVGIAGPRRRGWPVVVADGEIVWVPGVRRAYVAAVRSGRPVRRLVCERLSS